MKIEMDDPDIPETDFFPRIATLLETVDRVAYLTDKVTVRLLGYSEGPNVEAVTPSPKGFFPYLSNSLTHCYQQLQRIESMLHRLEEIE